MKRLIIIWMISLLLLSSFAYAEEEAREGGFFSRFFSTVVTLFVKVFSPEPKEVSESVKEVKEETVLEEPEIEEVEEESEFVQEPEEVIQEVKEPEMTASSGGSSAETVEKLPELKDSNNKVVPYAKEALGSKDSREYMFKDRKYTLEVFSAESSGNSILKVRDNSFRMKPGEFKHSEGLLIRNKGVVSDEGGAVPKINLEVYYVGKENNYCTPNVQCNNDELVWTDCDRNRKIKIDVCDESVQKKDEKALKDSEGNVVPFVEGVFDRGANAYSLGGKDFTLTVLGHNPTGEARLEIDDQQFTLKTGEYKQVNGLLVLNRGARFELIGDTMAVTSKVALAIFYIGRENICSLKVECVRDKLIWTSCDRARTVDLGGCGIGPTEEASCENPDGCDETPACYEGGTDKRIPCPEPVEEEI